MVDPENRLLCRFPRKRLDGEAIRDAMLHAAESLNLRAGGPGVLPPLPAELQETLLKDQWKVTADIAEHDRRSIYLFARRNLRFPILEAFDRPDANASCALRNRSTTALQSLYLLNSEFALASARRLAGAIGNPSSDDFRPAIRELYQRALSRPPQPDELQEAVAFLTEQARWLAAEGRAAASLASPEPSWAEADPYAAAAFTDLCLAVFNLNEFVYLD